MRAQSIFLIVAMISLAGCNSELSTVKGNWNKGLCAGYTADSLNMLSCSGDVGLEILDSSIVVDGKTFKYEVVESGSGYFVFELTIPSANGPQKMRETLRLVAPSVIKFGKNFYVNDLEQYPKCK